uniref:Integrin beta n=1 Tax=Eriocheir sinensis TaxID=95602 RepID=A0A5Q0TX88_ERISI|nr:integrin beta 2 [Eriocheir sinensis]
MRVAAAAVLLVMVVAAAGGVWAQEGAEDDCEAQGRCSDCMQTPECVWCINPKLDMKNCQNEVSINMTSFCDPDDLEDPQNSVAEGGDHMTGGLCARADEKECKAQGQCSDCIQTPGCVWCINPKVDMKNCQLGVSITDPTSFCDPADLHDPKNNVTVVEDEELTVKGAGDATSEQPQNIIQLKPQRFKLSLKKGVPQNITIKFRRALAYPVDLYYLMDLSQSMKDDKEQLANVSQVLTETLGRLTDQYTIGFGSFVDKVMMPYTDTSTLKLANPCDNCSKPYSFRNDMKLTRNSETFKAGVQNASISGNLDTPEGGLDALMQAMVCKEEIGWRDRARRILVFSTDDKFHVAGDGRLAGVVTPNDENCHLNEDGEYTAYAQFDYPSINQINKVAKERGINVIFAVLSHRELYEGLSKRIETSSFGMLEKGSINVVDLIQKQYESISSEVTLSDNSTDDLTIAYSSACSGSEITKTNKCGHIKENDTVTFTLEVTVNRCPADGKGSIVEVKTLEDKVILDIEFLCSCDCPIDRNISKCSSHGRQVCGVCSCFEGYSGKKCQCTADGDFSDDENKRCKANVDDERVCSGRGTCKCGECICYENVTGDFCQCDGRLCSLAKGPACSNNGVCECDKCKCNPGYTGAFCDCLSEACIQPGSDKVCSGHGTCDCDKCRCDSQGNETYTGKYCEDCLRCGTGKCNQFRDCVQCIHFGKGPRKQDCNTCEKSEPVESLDEMMYTGARLCNFEDEDGCIVNFTYRYLENQNKEEVFVQNERQCSPPPPILPIVFALIGTIVAIGILTLIIWKIFTTIHDRREYKKFESESRNAQFSSVDCGKPDVVVIQECLPYMTSEHMNDSVTHQQSLRICEHRAADSVAGGGGGGGSARQSNTRTHTVLRLVYTCPAEESVQRGSRSDSKPPVKSPEIDIEEYIEEESPEESRERAETVQCIVQKESRESERESKEGPQKSPEKRIEGQ